jgi:hypothetical protein
MINDELVVRCVSVSIFIERGKQSRQLKRFRMAMAESES